MIERPADDPNQDSDAPKDDPSNGGDKKGEVSRSVLEKSEGGNKEPDKTQAEDIVNTQPAPTGSEKKA